MAKTIFKNEMASHSLRHRAICEDDSFKGPWRTNIEDAYADARGHRQHQGNDLHIIRIVTEQTLSMKFEE
jgi:hypothetical protein